MSGVIDIDILQRLGLTALHFLWQGAIVGAGGFFLAKTLPDASRRYALLVATFFVMALCPVATWFVLANGPVGLAPLSLDPSILTELGLWSGAIWVAGVGIGSLRMAVGWLVLQRHLRRSALSPTRDLRESLRRMADRLGVSRAVELVVSPLIDGPATTGVLRAAIYLPASLITRLSPEQIEALIAHELAHIRRHDFAVNLVQSIIEVALFFHPAVWWISARIRVEREHCCDDLAIESVGSPAVYANALLQLEVSRPKLTLACAATDGDLLSRLRRMGRRDDFRPTRAACAGWLLMLVVGLLTCLGLTSKSTTRADAVLRPVVQRERDFLVFVPATRSEQHALLLQPLPNHVLPKGAKVTVRAWRSSSATSNGHVTVTTTVRTESTAHGYYEVVTYQTNEVSESHRLLEVN